MIQVCSCIMGSGKSSAAIRYINDHPNDKFIYITPYLTEAARIRENCKAMKFVEPTNKDGRYSFKKTTHTAALIKQGKNITTTHQAFKGYTNEMLDDIKEFGYTLIIDENVEVLEKFPCHPDDLEMAASAGFIKEQDGVYTIGDREYHGAVLSEMYRLIGSRDLVHVQAGKGENCYYWALPPNLITSFRDVFILTYLFEGQSIHHFLEIYGIPYEYIGIERTEDGGYRFGSYPGYVPEYVHHLKDRLHIIDGGKLNVVGDDYYALSISWFDNKADKVSQLKRNVINCYNNIWRDIPADRRLWGSYKGAYNMIKGKGYTQSFLSFNAKATNEYKDRDHLVYVANPFMNVGEKTFYRKHGIEVDEDMYSLSIAVQWIWRSAIREGSDVYLYIPSRRMRTLIENWINSFETKEAS